ncbi:hypothetical protein RclHR1_03790008 [Rhizophagus clarus]|uniref:MATA-HMG n=1 Tax=Rhizophagus clarus TaxID=94130 RepID=A0A2Z6RPV1_9GLOM|nr:hypothetical protein RclHR1_03790008 [Rhizophagus clarus]GES83588.1 hypothetical protein GLOIN_2v1484954 [Rhizophagus clarus]
MDTKYKPVHHLNGAGQQLISVPCYGFYDIPIPPAKFYEFKNYRKVNGFMLFRTLIQKSFSQGVGYSSHKSSKIWAAADEDFKEIFVKIANDINKMEKEIEFKHFQEKQYKSKPKSKANKFKSNKAVTEPVKQEATIGDIFQDDVNCFSFTSFQNP